MLNIFPLSHAFLLGVILDLACSLLVQSAPAIPQLFLWDTANLTTAKARLAKNDPEMLSAYQQLIQEAESALGAKLESVMDKQAVPSSGDKHDYMSLAPYFWPNPDTPNGLPYIRKDGEHNPESNQEENTDVLRHRRMEQNVVTLSLAYYFSGDEKYAQKAAAVVRTWFLDPATAMNPNLNFGQAVRGENEGRCTGLIEMSNFPNLIDCLGILSLSSAWRAQDNQAMHAWVARYFEWLTESKIGQEESGQPNNHGTYMDAQCISLALYLGKNDYAKDLLEKSKQFRIEGQIEPDGRQPLELARTNSEHYSIYNLMGLFSLACLGKTVGIDLFHHTSADGRGLQKALAFMVPYLDPATKWPYPQITPHDPAYLLPVLRQAEWAYADKSYETSIRMVQREKPADRSILLYPPLN